MKHYLYNPQFEDEAQLQGYEFEEISDDTVKVSTRYTFEEYQKDWGTVEFLSKKSARQKWKTLKDNGFIHMKD